MLKVTRERLDGEIHDTLLQIKNEIAKQQEGMSKRHTETRIGGARRKTDLKEQERRNCTERIPSYNFKKPDRQPAVVTEQAY